MLGFQILRRHFLKSGLLAILVHRSSPSVAQIQNAPIIDAALSVTTPHTAQLFWTYENGQTDTSYDLEATSFEKEQPAQRIIQNAKSGMKLEGLNGYAKFEFRVRAVQGSSNLAWGPRCVLCTGIPRPSQPVLGGLPTGLGFVRWSLSFDSGAVSNLSSLSATLYRVRGDSLTLNLMVSIAAPIAGGTYLTAGHLFGDGYQLVLSGPDLGSGSGSVTSPPSEISLTNVAAVDGVGIPSLSPSMRHTRLF